MSLPRFSFEEAVYRELDQIRRAYEKQADTIAEAVSRLERRDEERDARAERRDEARDEEVSELKMQLAKLIHQRGSVPPSRDWKRDAGLVIAPSTIVAIIGAIAQHFTAPEPAPPPAPRPSTVQVTP